MFIKTSIFKKLLKEAYKNDNLSVGHSEKAKVYYIVGGYWFVAVQEQFFLMLKKRLLLNLLEICHGMNMFEYIKMNHGSSWYQTR